MRLGKSWQQRKKEMQEELEALQGGEDWFAWFPVKTNHGVWAWLEVVHLDYGVYQYDGEWRCLDRPPTAHLKGDTDG